MDEELRYCTLSRASLWNGLNQDGLDYLKESGVTVMPHNYDDLGYSFQAEVTVGPHISDLIEGGII